MSHVDLDRVFGAGAQPEGAQRIFTDRVSEQEAFDASLGWYRRELAALRAGTWSEQDLQRQRRNVLTYFGVGGIGKTSLLRVLQDRVGRGDIAPDHWPDPPSPSDDLRSVSYDLRAIGEPSLESLLLALRSELAAARIACSAFDLLLTRYWQHVHPGESLTDFLQKNSRLRRWATTVGLPDQMETAVGDIAAELGSISAVGSSVTRATKATVSALRSSRRMAHALDRCTLLSDLLETPPDVDALAYYAHALSWDLAEAQRSSGLGLVVFLDTFEDTPGALEDQVQRLVWLMPNVLFVIAGRDRLRWADPGRVDAPRFRQGPEHWPGLAASSTDDPEQHLVGFLSDTDARSYLAAALGGTAAEKALLDVIVARAAGLPIHLDLAVDRALSLAAHGEIERDELDLSFPELAARTLRDLSADQRRAVLAACMFDAFDVELVRAAAGLEQSGPVLRLVERSLVADASSLPLPFAVHEVLRGALLQTESLGEDSWSAEDFRRAARRALVELRRRWDDGSTDKGFLLQQALRIARTYGEADPWLPEAAVELTERSNWTPTWQAPAIETAILGRDGPPWIGALADGLALVVRRQSMRRDHVADGLGRMIALAPDSPELDVLRYFRAEALRDAGDLREARQLLDRLNDAGGVLELRALHANIHLLRREGYFGEVGEILEGHSEVPTRHRLLGDLLWTQAQFDRAADAYRTAGAVARERGDLGEAALCTVSQVYSQSFLDPRGAAAELGRAGEELASAPYLSFNAQLADVARLLIVADDARLAADVETTVRQQLTTSGHSSIHAYVTLAALIGSCIRDDTTRTNVLLQELDGLVRGRMFGYLVDIGETVAAQQPIASPRADWTDGALGRWSRLVSIRREAST